MSMLPEVRTDHEAMKTHRVRLVRTIDKFKEWRQSKVDEYPGNTTATRRGRRSVAALESLAEYVESLPDDDTTLQLTFRAFHNPLQSDVSTYLLRQDTAKLRRYGMGLLSDPTDADHNQFLRSLASAEIQVIKRTDEQHAYQLAGEVYKRVRQLRFLQARASDELAAQIGRQLQEIWDNTYVAPQADPQDDDAA
jgi:hypothetical protein